MLGGAEREEGGGLIDTLAAILEQKGLAVHSVGPDSSVLEAVHAMNEHRIGAVLVCDGDRPVGIFTERDVLTRMVEQKRDPAHTTVADVMTRELVSVRPSTTVDEAMAVITARRCRHLPVVDGDRVVGVVSIGDLTRWLTRNQKHHIENLVNYITGKYPA